MLAYWCLYDRVAASMRKDDALLEIGGRTWVVTRDIGVG